MEKRESFKSHIGFLLVSAGCAIGIGNVWKFPYVAGQNGGGVFVLFYLIFLLILGVPVLSMELAVGRASRQSAVEAYRTLEKPGHKWHFHGVICIIGNILLMMYYTTVCGWMFNYFFKFMTGTFENLPAAADGSVKEAVADVFTAMQHNTLEVLIFTFLTIIIGFVVVSFGLQNGIERITKVMMTGLLLLIVVLAVNSCLLPGASEGVKFYLLPDFARAAEVGIFNVMTAAMNQAFFTLSLGMASMEIFGSYMSKDRTLVTESVQICVLDTFVALMSGMIIFPACFSFGVQPDAGPPLIFETLPNVFANMAGGRIWGTLFFLFMTFASFTTVIAVFENIIRSLMDSLGWKRIKTVIISGVGLLILSLPCVFGDGIWENVTLIGGRDILNTEDFIVSNIILPVGSLIYLLFCVTRFGWGFDNYLEECNTGKGIRMPAMFRHYFRFVMPILILVILINGLIPA
ncbi:MAG: sodium-dependent transporter [Ruminococcaceae bacterium]|nr:sodium-dependent transporter [Oscillospiraceae bacterium]